jgi:hypothetical protein
LITLLCGIAVFSLFHLIARYPLVWFAITLAWARAMDGCRSRPGIRTAGQAPSVIASNMQLAR